MEVDEEEIVESILSVCWDNGKTAAVAYNLSTLELFVSKYYTKKNLKKKLKLINNSRFSMKLLTYDLTMSN